VAILDPLLTVSQPARVTACTGIDALAHALETAVTKKRTALSAMFSREAFRLCFTGLERVLRRADDVEARGLMLLGAALAGTAIENSMLGAAHAAANPLTAKFGVVHGQAVGVMLPAVIAYNAADETTKALYLEHAAVVGIDSVEELISRVEELLALADMRSLQLNGALAPALPELAASAAGQWTATFNPRPITAPDFERLYQEVLG
jgi:alcohol dehydrogenase